MPLLAHDGVRLHYDIYGDPGDRPPLLLSHGFSASGRMWELNVAALAGDREVLTWDLRGHARSDAPDDPAAYGVEQSVRDMVALLDMLGAKRAVLGGMSLGGYLSLAFHTRHPGRVAGLVLIDTGPGFRREQPREQWNRFAERTAQALERDGLAALRASPEVAQHRDAHGLAHTARRVMAQKDAHVIDSLERIAVPTLVIVGAEDRNFLSAADYMAAKIPGARKVVLDGAGHAANIDAADQFNAAVSEFLEAV
ncbi:MAG TPA: alpha/beta fold hydrolase [Solirubrobacteraceae bacterium]|nr:alpha/beta fold hydrolase [Solirubrobacteraceae bacterium]